MQTATTSAAASKSSMETFRLAIVGEGPAALAAVKYAVSQKVRVALCWTGIQNCMPELTAAIPPCKDYFPGEEEKDSKTFAELVHDVEKTSRRLCISSACAASVGRMLFRRGKTGWAVSVLRGGQENPLPAVNHCTVGILPATAVAEQRRSRLPSPVGPGRSFRHTAASCRDRFSARRRAFGRSFSDGKALLSRSFHPTILFFRRKTPLLRSSF